MEALIAAAEEYQHAKPEVEVIRAPTHCCRVCRCSTVSEEGAMCEDCLTDFERGYRPMQLAGRCRTGSDWQRTPVVHAVRLEYNMDRQRWQNTGVAMCSAKPKGLSAGWSEWHRDEVTCPRCKHKIEKGKAK